MPNVPTAAVIQAWCAKVAAQAIWVYTVKPDSDTLDCIKAILKQAMKDIRGCLPSGPGPDCPPGYKKVDDLCEPDEL